MPHDRLELFDSDLRNLSIVEHLRAAQKFFVQCTVALMPQLYVGEGGFDNLCSVKLKS